MRGKLLLLASVLVLSSTSYAKQMGESLFIEKCSACHVMQIPEDRSTLVGPPARGIMFHMSEAFSNKKDIQSHIEDFVLNPTKEKAICRSIRRFGLMPSQKGLITKEELIVVSKWMTENLSMSAQEHNVNQRKRQQQ